VEKRRVEDGFDVLPEEKKKPPFGEKNKSGEEVVVLETKGKKEPDNYYGFYGGTILPKGKRKIRKGRLMRDHQRGEKTD